MPPAQPPASSPEADHEAGRDPAPPRSRWRLVGRLAIAVLVVAMVAMWAGIFLGYFDRTAPGTLGDPTFPQAAEPICVSAKSALAALPPAYQTTDHVARADVVAQSNTILRDMLTRLDAIAPTDGKDGSMTQE